MNTRAPAHRALVLWLAGGGIVTVLLAFVSLVVGTSDVGTSWQWIVTGDSDAGVVLWDIRLPRSIGAWSVGALLALAGGIAQGVFRNPLADPYLLGSASGAALGVTLCLVVMEGAPGALDWAARLGVAGAAFVGACGAVALTITLARGALQTASLLLAGIVVAFVLNAVSSLVLLAYPEVWRSMQSFLFGTTGFLGWSSAGFVGLALVACAIAAVPFARGLDALALGEDTAHSMGIPIPGLRLALLGIVSLGTAAAVSQVGVVSFIGLVAPHIVRQTTTLAWRPLLLASMMCGGILLQLADLASRWLIRPAEVPVGALTACIGGAYLVLLMWRRSRDG